MNCLYDERTEKNENQKKKKCCLIMIEGKENKNDAPLPMPWGVLKSTRTYGKLLLSKFETLVKGNI